MSRRRERGLALVSVLWGVSILSLIAAAMLTAALTQARVARNAEDAAQADGLADGAVQLAVLSLLDDRPDRQPRIDGVPGIVRWAGARVRVAIQDEGGLININFADKETLSRLLQSAGSERGAADDLAERIVARRTGQPSPASLPFETLDQLLQIRGMNEALFNRIAPALTVYGGGNVDPETAPPAVLRALPDYDAGRIADILRARKEAYEKRGQAPAAGPLAKPGASFAVTAQSVFGSARATRKAVVLITGDPGNAVLVQEWD